MTSKTDYDNTLPEPLKHIGAQDLGGFHGGCTRNGFLRKQGKLERMFKFLTWRQRYVVIAHGCIYIFKNEFSRSYIMAVALGTYNKTIRGTNIPRMPFVFRVMPHDPTTGKILVFSCPDEANQKSWMAAIKKDLLKANDVSTKDIDDDSLEDYVYLEKDVRTIKEEVAASNKQPDPEKDYSIIKDTDVVKHLGRKPTSPHSTSSLPSQHTTKQEFTNKPPKSSTIATAQPASDLKNKTKATQPTSPTNNKPFKKKMQTPNQTQNKQRKPTLTDDEDDEKPFTDRKSYMYEGTDREQVEGLLLSKTEGTFLIRTSRSDGREVLSINIGDSLKEFKIYIKEKKCTIDNKTYFDSTDELLLYYHNNNLPGKTVKLTKAYLLQSAGYVNQRFSP